LRHIWAGVILILVATACGGDDLTLSEYNEQGMTLVIAMEEQLSALDAEWDSHEPTVERARSYWNSRIDARDEALEGLEALKAPDGLADLLGHGLGLFTEQITAEKALAARVISFDTVTGPEQWWGTTEGKAVQALDEEINAFCQVVQARYDATIERVILSDVPWIPSDMKEMVQIDIGCEQ
jgi:hypothetical protein